MGQDEFRFLRPFHRVFSKCLELTQAAQAGQATPSEATQPAAT